MARMKTIPAAEISKDDVLVEKDTGKKVTVLETSRSEIAWLKMIPEGGVFGQCARVHAPSLFKNVST